MIEIINKNIFKKGEFYIALVMLAFSAVAQTQVMQIQIKESRTLPQLITALMFLCSAATLVLAAFGKKQEKGGAHLLFTRKQIVAVLVLAVFGASARTIGFYAGIFLLTVCISLLMAMPEKISLKRLAVIILSCAVLTALLAIGFIYIFRLYTPKGFLI